MKTTTGRRRKPRKTRRQPGRPAKTERKPVNVRIDLDLYEWVCTVAIELVRAQGGPASISDALNYILRAARPDGYCRHGRLMEGECERCAVEQTLNALLAERQAKGDRARAGDG